MSKWLQVWFKDIQRGCLIRGIATAVGLPLGGCLIMTTICAISGLPAQSEGASFWATLLLAMLPVFLLVGGALGGVAYVFWRRGRWLDELMAPLGLEGSSYALSGRQYHGRYQNRQLDIFVYRGPGLLFYVSADAGTRLSVAAQDEIVPQLAQAFNGRPLEHNQPALAGITIFAHDEAWGQAFARETAVQDALTRLIRGQHGFVFRQVHVRPDAVFLKLYRATQTLQLELEAAQIAEWSAGLLQLAEAVEQLPPPAERLAATPLENRLRKGNVNVGMITLAILAASLLLVLCVTAAIMLPVFAWRPLLYCLYLL